ncbi:class I SAM-dependent methyltransferase [Candidatus Laterigemmans baculatus]|uniref:class I SAM-dependent methyltransferase n=1 Tax=Candidatus Laterigemmans baculatus TaxID=2770505 RepID=UPI0013DB8788|nr:class I SAM-dependent methyltransferase [Candidatus Laterigemmans baculatus]
MEEVSESIYDHPKYYDLVFGADCAAELKFLEGCNAKHLEGRAERWFEPACGTGRLLFRLAQRGYAVGGIDLNPKAVEFCNRRLERHGFAAAVEGDMAAFKLAELRDSSSRSEPKLWDLAFNTINSFRHLGTERAARSHLECLAGVVRSGGLYVLGLHLRCTEAPPSETESWSARRGNLAVNTHMWTLERNVPKRVERFGIRFDVHTPTRQFRISDELVLRSYTDRELRRLVKSAGGWEIEETYDFSYDIDAPIAVDATCEDVVYVLRRTAERA